MKAKVIETEISKDGVIHIQDQELKPGKVEVVVLLREPDTSSLLKKPAKCLPLGGHKAGWLTPEQLRRESMYE